MSNQYQYTKINTSGFGKAKRFFISVQRSALPEELKEKSASIYQPITENIHRVLRGFTYKNQGAFESILYFDSEKQAKKLANEIDDILNNNNHNLF